VCCVAVASSAGRGRDNHQSPQQHGYGSGSLPARKPQLHRPAVHAYVPALCERVRPTARGVRLGE